MIRKLRKHFMKLFLATVIVTTALLFFALRSDFVADSVQRYALAYLEENMQCRIEMGRPKIEWLRSSWSIKKVSITPRGQKREFLKAESVRISFFPWWNLINREIGIRFVEVVDPAIYFRIEKGDVANLPNFDFLEGKEGFFRFSLKEIRILNGRMDMSYPETPMEITFSNIGMKISPDFRKEYYAFSLTDSTAVIKVNEFIQRINSLKGDFDVTPEYLKIKRAALATPEGKASTSAFDLNFDTAQWETRITSTIDLSALKKVIRNQWPAGPTREKYLDKLTVKGTADIDATIKADDDNFDVMGKVKSSEIELDGKRIRNLTSSVSSKGAWDSITEASLDVDAESKVPFEVLNRYFEGLPKLKGGADLHIRSAIEEGPWSAGNKIRIEGDLSSVGFEAGDISLAKASARFKADQQKVEISNIKANLMGGSLKGNINHEMKTAGEFKGSFSIDNIELNEVSKRIASARGKKMNAKLGGKLSGNVDLTGNLEPGLKVNSISTLQLQAFNISNDNGLSTKIDRATTAADISYDGGIVSLRSVNIKTPASALSLSGEISEGRLSLGFKVDSSDLGELDGRVRGAGIIKGRISGNTDNPEFEGEVDLKKTSWDRYHADSVTGNIGYKDHNMSTTGLVVGHGRSELSVKGNVSFSGAHPEISIQSAMKNGRLEDLLSMTGSDLDGKGDLSYACRFKGALKELDGDATIKGNRMMLFGEEVDSVDIAGTMEKGKLLLKKGDIARDTDRISVKGIMSPDGGLDMTVLTSPLSIKTLPFAKKFKDKLNGTAEIEGLITGEIKNPSFKGKAALSGIGYKQINLGSGNLEILVANRLLTASGKAFGAEVTGNLLLKDNKPFSLSAGMNDLPLAPYFRGMARLEDLTGAVSGRMEIHGELSNTEEAAGFLSISKLQLVKNPFLLKNVGNIELVFDNGRLNISHFQMRGKGTELHTSGWMKTDGDTNLFINGSVDLYLLQLFTKAIEKGAGVAELRLTIAGKPPRMEGNIFIKDGVVGIKGFDPVFRDISGNITLDGEALIIETLDGRIGEGRFNGEGTIEMSGLALKRTDISFDVNGLRLAYPRWLPSEVEGTLRLSGEYPSLLISGDMNVVKARYSERVDWATILPSFKQRFREPEGEKKGLGSLGIDINFKADRNLIFENNVGKGELKGEIKLKLENGKFGIVGQVEVMTGKVFYKEHEFKITSGVIEFPDPKKMEAVFDFTAEGRVREYTVQILVQGNTNDFKVIMTSTPALSELDIASLLSLGLTSREFQERGGVAPAYGAASLLSREMEGKFKDYIGFDRFHIDPYYSKITGTTEPKLTVGKEVSEDVQVLYSRGLTGTGEQEVQMEYKLYRNFSILGGWSSFGASREGDLGADIKYRFEFR